jgi:hypothetical protein
MIGVMWKERLGTQGEWVKKKRGLCVEVAVGGGEEGISRGGSGGWGVGLVRA